MFLGLELRPFCQDFVAAAHSPDCQRHTGHGQSGGGSRAVHRSRLSSPAALADALVPGAAPRPRCSSQTSDPGSRSPPGHGRCKETPCSLQAAEQGRFRPSQRFRSRHCTLPWMLLGNPAGCSCSCRGYRVLGRD